MKKLICKLFKHRPPNGKNIRDAFTCTRCGKHEPEYLTEADYQTWSRK